MGTLKCHLGSRAGSCSPSPTIIMQSTTKRRRVERSPSPAYKLDDEDDSYVPYVPVAQRRQAKIAKLTSRGNASKGEERNSAEQDDQDEEMLEEERRKEMERRERTLLMEAQEVHSKKAAQGTWHLCYSCEYATNLSLDAKKTEEEKTTEADEEILRAIQSRRKLASDLELAHGVSYTESLNTRCVSVRYCLGARSN